MLQCTNYFAYLLCCSYIVYLLYRLIGIVNSACLLKMYMFCLVPYLDCFLCCVLSIPLPNLTGIRHHDILLVQNIL